MRPGIWQLLIVILIIVVIFGGKKIPELARSLGKAKGEFKKGLAEGEKAESAASEAPEAK
ncbi:MAG: twin-arginine translocase TatA/TatE family subunit [Kiritimatiellae bacterium]|jgi:sec-independent protein translocase protein TatA|nr:twin-arginine translocase TatA/TatE family subunit [Kiritimatiellia bacterium]